MVHPRIPLHIFVPFVLESTGAPGKRAAAFLKDLDKYAQEPLQFLTYATQRLALADNTMITQEGQLHVHAQSQRPKLNALMRAVPEHAATPVFDSPCEVASPRIIRFFTRRISCRGASDCRQPRLRWQALSSHFQPLSQLRPNNIEFGFCQYFEFGLFVTYSLVCQQRTRFFSSRMADFPST